MNFKLILLSCILASLAATQIAAQCVCGAEGEDVCSCSQTRIPRPLQLSRVQPQPIQQSTSRCTCPFSQNRQQFRPVGDRCSCENRLVQPAIRPACTCQKKTSSSSISTETSSDCGQIIHVPFDSTDLDRTNHMRKEDYSSQLPIDPVSMSLAYINAHRASIMVPEEKLAYGFKKIPVNAEKKKEIPHIPEEQLYTFDRKVVQLTDIPCHKHKKIEEEEEEEEEEEAKPDCGLGYLNYNQMGYYPQKHQDTRFTVTKFEAEADPEKPCDSQEPIQEIGSCGYRPGRVVDDAGSDDELRAYVVNNDDVGNYRLV